MLSQAESSEMLMGIRETLEDPNLVTMMQKIQVVIHDEAKLAKGSAAMKLQRCFAVRKGLNDLLDTARTTYCRIVDDIEAKVTQLGEAHGYPMRLGYNASRGYHIQMTVQVWSLTQFYSVDFSKLRIGVNKCVFYKCKIKVCIICC